MYFQNANLKVHFATFRAKHVATFQNADFQQNARLSFRNIFE